ncbi:MAG TPA: FUSC family protein [Steroidobacteraceae bacterium]|nr:FUSC family protein [Steroidobacteraceae bacterium]
MNARAMVLVALLVLPATAAYATGYDRFAHYSVLGTVLAFHLGVQARHLAPFGVLIPLVYAAAAITANFTDGVAALIVAVAAATGAASSLGYHRGLLAVLAAVLIGACEPATAAVAAQQSLAMFAGCAYGVLIVQTVGRGLTTHTLAVNSQTALGYSMLLAVLVLVAWFTARALAIDEVWWLPLTVAALGEPWLASTPGRAVGRLALALAATLLGLSLLEPIAEPALRAACAIVLLLGLVMSGRERAWLQGFLFTPVLVLLASDDQNYAPAHYLESTLLAFMVVAVSTVLGKWVLWTLRPDAGHAVV